MIDKPVGLTSFRVVQYVRRALQIKKVGHAGTLDPFASGLLIVCAGRPATRMVPNLMEGEKEYVATLRLGIETDSQDLTGKVVAEHNFEAFDIIEVEHCLAGFVGISFQVPPVYSALKHMGKPLYYYARQGIEIVKEPRRIEIFELECLDFKENDLSIRVVCSKGTYIRTLASDIGRVLGCGAHLVSLRRLRSGRFSVSDAVAGADLENKQTAKPLLLSRCLRIEDILK